MAFLILGGLSIQDLLSSGSVKSYSFLLDMNQLFERFVEKLIRALLASSPIRIHSQHREGSILWNVTLNRRHAHVIPDLLLEHETLPSHRLVIDAKYKRYDNRKISNADINQTFLYAYAFHAGVDTMPRALLLYPASQPTMQSTRLRVRTKRGTSAAEIQALGIPVKSILDELRSTGPRELCLSLIHHIHEAMELSSFTVKT